MVSSSGIVLSEDYYVVNFHKLCAFVTSTYSDLLTADESHWYGSICSLSDPAQRLYIRLLMRRGSTFRLSRLKYREIADIPAAVRELDRQNLGTTMPPDSLSVLLPKYMRTELCSLLAFAEVAGQNRQDILEKVNRSSQSTRQAIIETLAAADSWITIRGHQHFSLMQLCFFGNLFQDIREFVLRDLGSVRFADYTLSTKNRPFRTREQVQAHLKYYECRALSEIVDRKDPQALLELAGQLPESPESDVHLRRRVDKLRNRLARQLERLSEHQSAMALYTISMHPPARERRVRWLMSEERFAEARALCDSMVNQPLNEAELQMAQKLHSKLHRQSSPNAGKAAGFKPTTSRLVLKQCGKRVEIAACRFYNRSGACYYVENSLVTGILGLLIWDVVFQCVPGAFFNPFQSAPADFLLPSFATSRQQRLSLRLSEIDDRPRFEARVLNNFEQYHGIANPLVHWKRLKPELLERAIDRVPAQHWHFLFNRILGDLRENTTGLPDLVFFPEEGGYELLEIKGPGDALQSNQRRWLDYFDQHRIPSRVVQVRWAEQLPR